MTACVVADCKRDARCMGWCGMHYHRWVRHGSPLVVGDNASHGHCRPFKSATYNSWAMMIARCSRPTSNGYEYYGGRGISVCEHWQGARGFENFLADMRERPPGRILGRVDVDGNYTPENCRWATRKEQQAARRLSGPVAGLEVAPR